MLRKISNKMSAVALSISFIILVLFSMGIYNAYADNETVTITFVRNWGNGLNGNVGDQTTTYTHTFNAGDKLPGHNPFGTDSITRVGPIFDNHWLRVGGPFDLLFGGDFGRTYSWNTAADLSGTYYRGSHVITPDMDGLTLYQSWVNGNDALSLPGNINNSNLYKVDIKLNQGDYENSANPNNSEYDASLPYPNYVDGIGNDDNIPYKVDQAMTLNYRSTLDFSAAKRYLAVLWGRIDKVRSMHGTMTAKFDARLEFDNDIEISYESSWLEPDERRLAQYGVREVITTQIDENTWRHTFIVSSSFVNTNIQTIQGVDYKIATIPVTGAKDLSNNTVSGALEGDVAGLRTLRTKFGTLSFDNFMRDMQLSVADNFDRGINAIITRDSYNQIANGTNPVVITKGAIELVITGNFSGMEETYRMSAIANDEMAKLYPSGTVEIDYKEIGTYIPLMATQDGDVDADEYKTVLIGRSKHNVSLTEASTDPEDFSAPYEVRVPMIDGYTFVGVQTENKREVDTQLSGEFKHSITPKITLLYQRNGVLDVKYVIRGTDIEIKDSRVLVDRAQTLSTREYSVSGEEVKTVHYNGNSTVDYDLPEIIEYRSASYRLYGRRESSASDVSGILTPEDQTIIYEYELIDEEIPPATPSEPDEEIEIPATPSEPDEVIPSTPSEPDKEVPVTPSIPTVSEPNTGGFGGGSGYSGGGSSPNPGSGGPGVNNKQPEAEVIIENTIKEPEPEVTQVISNRVPKTGDSSNSIIYYILGYMAIICTVVLFMYKKRNIIDKK